MPYTPTTWVNNASPFINAANLNHLEQQMATNTTDIATLQAGGGGGGGGGFFGGVLVASNDADAATKAAAGAAFTCDGTADQVQINNALIQAAIIAGQGGPAGGAWRGTVFLSGGRFFCNGSILVQNATRLTGAGKSTILYPVSLSAVTGAGANPALIKLATVNDHLTEISNLHINLNAAGGGTGHGINLDMTGGAATSGLPDMNPDSDHSIFNISMNNGNNAARHGIWFLQDTGSHSRGNMIYGCQIRLCGGNGVRVENASDMLVSNNHMGGSGSYGYFISGGNTMLFGNKSYFSDVGGYNIASGRALVSACSSQDELSGFTIGGGNVLLNGCMVDTAQDWFFQLNSNGTVLNGCYGFVRGGGRYATATRGVYFPSAIAGCKVDVAIDPSNVTTPFSGSFTGNRGQIVNSDTGALFASA